MTYLAVNQTIEESWILVSVSDDSNPNGVWCNWALRGDRNGSTASGNWSDYQGMGYDSQAVYVVPNQFTWAGAFDYAKIRILHKSTLYNTSCPAITWTDLWDLRYPIAVGEGAEAIATFTVRPAVTFGTPGTEFLMANSFFQPPFNDFMVLYRLTNPLTSPTLAADVIPVGATFPPPNADQLDGGTPRIDVGGLRIRNVVYRNGSVWTAHSVSMSGTDPLAWARYVRVNVSGPTVLEDVAIAVNNCWLYYPAIMADVNSNMAMVYNRSCTTEYAGIRYSTRANGDVLEADALLKAGEANYVKTFGGDSNRWGDYSGIAVDPANPTSIWMFAEYAESPSGALGGTWGTWFGQVQFPGVNPPSLLTPNDNALLNDDTPFFDWSDSTGDLADYLLRVTSGDIDAGPFDLDVVVNSVSQYQVQSADALTDAAYQWQVIARDASATNTASSVTRAFTIDTVAPGQPVLTSPADGSSGDDTTPTFTWGSVADPSGVTYDLQIALGTADFANLAFTADGIQQTQFTLSSADALATGDYIWQVRAVDGAGNTGDFSASFTLIVSPLADVTPPGVPTLLSPPDGSSGDNATPTFSWSAVLDASGVTYTLEIAFGTADFANLAFTADGIQQTQFTLP